MPTQLMRQCPCCADERVFEVPPCAEGHGGECSERACLDCGTALLVDPLPVVPRPRSVRSALSAA
jgi:hypothetical protein